MVYQIKKQSLIAYFHDIKIKIGGYEFDCWAGFSRDIEALPYGFLGQLGFFNLFDVSLDYGKERIVEHCMALEHNNQALKDTIDIQYNNFIKIVADMEEVKAIHKKALRG